MKDVAAELRRLFDRVDPMPEPAPPPAFAGRHRMRPVPEPPGRRAGGTSSVSFAGAGTVVDLEFGPVLTGVLTPADAAGEVTVQWLSGAVLVPVDEHGVFEVDGVPPGPVRLVVAGAVTGWFVR